MNKKIIFLDVVLATFSFAITQVTADAGDLQGPYSGEYESTNPFTGAIEFTIDSEGNLDGTIMI